MVNHMQCSKCGFTNATEQKVCDVCGGRLKSPKVKKEKTREIDEKKEVQKSGEKKKTRESNGGWIADLFLALLELLFDL